MSDRVWQSPAFKPGDPLTASHRTARDAAIERNGRISGGAGLAVRDGAGGRSFAVVGQEVTTIKLTSSANANGGYSWKEVLAAPLGTWTDSGRTGSASVDPAYERNHNVSLSSGSRVYVARRAPTTAEWIFAHRVTAGPCTWTITVLGCTGAGYAGVTVTVVHGGGTVSGTTNGSGVVTFTGLATGSATATATAPSVRFADSSITRTLAAGTQSHSFSLGVASGYACCGCPDPIATTLYGTDSNGTWTFNWTGAGWSTCYTATDSSTGADLSCVPTTVTYSRQYIITCASGGTFTLTAKTSYVQCFPGYTTTGRCNSGAAEVLNSLGGYDPANNTGFSVKTGCLPLSLAFNIPNSGSFAFTVGTVTVTE